MLKFIKYIVDIVHSMIENFKIVADFPRKGRIYHVYILQYLLSRIMMIVMY